MTTAARFWFGALVIGQWALLYYIVAFYGSATVTGNFQSWNRNAHLIKGYVAGDTAGNLAFAAHALLAGVIAFGGALQLIPQIRARAVAIHRWNGRLFIMTAFAVSLTGLYMVWLRNTKLSMSGAIAVSLDALLIMICGALAWRFAVKRDFGAHRRWALRTFIVVNGQWFIRVGFFAWIILNHGQHAREFFRVWEFGSYLLPLAVLELYFHAKEEASRRAQFALAGVLVVLTLFMCVGIFGTATFMWRNVLTRI